MRLTPTIIPRGNLIYLFELVFVEDMKDSDVLHLCYQPGLTPGVLKDRNYGPWELIPFWLPDFVAYFKFTHHFYFLLTPQDSNSDPEDQNHVC